MTQPVGNYSPHLLLEQGSTIPKYIDAAGNRIPIVTSAALLVAEMRFVSKGGNDATGDGSLSSPFLTIQAALTSITDAASTKPYVVYVFPGTYTSTFTVKPWTFIQGCNRPSVILSPVQANWIDASFSAAGSQQGGIAGVTIGSAFAADFSLVASPGAGFFFLNDCYTNGVNVSVVGNNTNNRVFVDHVEEIAATTSTYSFTNIGGSLGEITLRGDNLTITNTAAYSINPFTIGNVAGVGTLTVTCTSTTNFLFIQGTGAHWLAGSGTPIVLTGDGVVFRSFSLVKTTPGPDANTTFDFLFAVGSTKLPDGALNLILVNPSADRTYTFNAPASATRIEVKNQSVNFITLVLNALGTSDSTYIPPFGMLQMWYSNGAWAAMNTTQFGSVQLSNGVSPLVPADITAQSRIVALLQNQNGSATVGPVINAKGTDRVVGTRAGGGGFVLTAQSAAGVTNAADQGIYDWIVCRP